MMVINMSFLLLCGVGGRMMFSSKEFILLEFLGTLIILVGWNYSKLFLSNVSLYNSSITLIGSSSLLLLLIGGSRFCNVEMVSVIFSMVVCLFVFNSMSGYVVNK